MLIKNKYPVCEFDTSRNPIIKPTDFLEKTLPSKCVITFFRKELEQLVEDEKLPVIGYLHSEVLDIPIYEHNLSKERICITTPFCTAPGAAGTIEELPLPPFRQGAFFSSIRCTSKWTRPAPAPGGPARTSRRIGESARRSPDPS